MITLEIFFIFIMTFLACTGAQTIGHILADILIPDKSEEAEGLTNQIPDQKVRE